MRVGSSRSIGCYNLERASIKCGHLHCCMMSASLTPTVSEHEISETNSIFSEAFSRPVRHFGSVPGSLKRNAQNPRKKVKQIPKEHITPPRLLRCPTLSHKHCSHLISSMAAAVAYWSYNQGPACHVVCMILQLWLQFFLILKSDSSHLASLLAMHTSAIMQL